MHITKIPETGLYKDSFGLFASWLWQIRGIYTYSLGTGNSNSFNADLGFTSGQPSLLIAMVF